MMRVYNITECIGHDNLEWFIVKYKNNKDIAKNIKDLIRIFVYIIREIDNDGELKLKVINHLKKSGNERAIFYAERIFGRNMA